MFSYIKLKERAGEEEDPILWWIKNKSSYPNLWRMAQDFLGIPATSTPSERLFSQAGEIFTSHRKSLQQDAACALLSLGSWWGNQGLTDIPDVNPPKCRHIDSIPVLIEDGIGGLSASYQGREETCNSALQDVAAAYDEGLQETAVDDNQPEEAVDDNQPEEATPGDEEIWPMDNESDCSIDDDDILEI